MSIIVIEKESIKMINLHETREQDKKRMNHLIPRKRTAYYMLNIMYAHLSIYLSINMICVCTVD